MASFGFILCSREHCLKALSTLTESQRYVFDSKYKLEYVWLDGYLPEPNLRSKTKVVNKAWFSRRSANVGV